MSTFVISTFPTSTNSFSTVNCNAVTLPFSISNEIGFSSGLYPAGVSTSTNSYFPIDKSETFAFPSLSVVTFATTFPFESRTSNTTFSNGALLSLSIFVISTFPVSTISFSTVNAKDFVIPFVISNGTGFSNFL